MSRISFLFVLLLLSSCWSRHALEVSRSYVPVFNPGGVLFDEDENFAQSYDIYEKRRRDVLKEKAKHKKGSEAECGSGCPEASEEKRSWILAKLREFGALSRDVVSSGNKGGMVNSKGVDLSALPGARFIEITLDKDDDDADGTKRAGSRDVATSDDVSRRSGYIELESGFPRLEAHRISAREAKALGCDCDEDGEVKHEHAAKSDCNCVRGDASGHKHVVRGKTSRGHAGRMEVADYGSVSAGMETEPEREKVIVGNVFGGLGEVECECEKTHECECKKGVVGSGVNERGLVDCTCEGDSGCVCGDVNAGPCYWEVNFECGESQECECDTEKGSIHEHAGGAGVTEKSAATGAYMDSPHECGCEGQYYGCRCKNGHEERATGGSEVNCECEGSHECECKKGFVGTVPGDGGLIDCACTGMAGCTCGDSSSGHVSSDSKMKCGCGNLHDCGCGEGDVSGRMHSESGESSFEKNIRGEIVTGQSGSVGIDATHECNCEGQHECKCGNGKVVSATGGVAADCECGKLHKCDCKESGLSHNPDCCDAVHSEEAVSSRVSEDVEDDRIFEEEQKETIARWEIGEIDTDFGMDDEQVEEQKQEEVITAPVEGGATERGNDTTTEKGADAGEVVDEFSDGLMEEGFTMNGGNVYPDYNWSKEALDDDFVDLMGGVAFPRGESGKGGTGAGGGETSSAGGGDGQHGPLHLGEDVSQDNLKGVEPVDPWGAYGNAEEYVAEDGQPKEFTDEKEGWSSFSDAKSREDRSHINIYAWYGV